MLAQDPRLIALRDSLPGRVLRGSGRVQYHIRERIGEGGQGWVFTANWDEPGGFVVIVKVLRPDAVNADTLRRFQREADVLRMLSQQGQPNPYIVRFFDHATAVLTSPTGGDGYTLPFTVLEYVSGTTLERVLDSQPGRGMAVERARRILRQVSQALEVVHAKKVIHRDLKPSNILLSTEAGGEVAKVTDFGLVKLVEVALARTSTLAGASLGYAPPEQYEQGNQRVSERTDVFSLAAITYEMLAGRMAFPYKDGENPLLIVTRILNEVRPQLAKTPESLAPELRSRPDLISVLDTHIGRALSADPNARHPTVQDFFSAIEPVLRAAAEKSGRPSAPPASRALPFSETVPASMSNVAASLRAGQIPVILPAEGPAPTPFDASGASQERYTRPSVPSPIPVSSLSPQASTGEPTGPVRPRGDTSNPALWTWRVVTPPIKPGVIRAGAFAADGDSGIGVGPTGLARWERGQWVGVALPAGFDPGRVRGAAMFGRDALVFGTGGLVMRVVATGGFEVFTISDAEATLHGAHVDPRGSLLLVGERPSRSLAPAGGKVPRAGLVVEYQGHRITQVADAPNTTRLRAVTRLASGAFAAVGDGGVLLRIERGVVSFRGSLCRGDLLAIAAANDGASFTVGTGGHAFSLTPALDWHLEAVQTTADLLSVFVTQDGTAWAGAQKARIVRRTGDSWVRMSGEVGVTSAACAIWATTHCVRALCDDGAVIEGRLP
jgi:serine/threonine protein kinase